MSENTNLTIPGYSVEKKFGDVQIWRRDEHDAPVRHWAVYNPIIIGGLDQVMKRINPNAPPPPDNSGIRFVADSR